MQDEETQTGDDLRIRLAKAQERKRVAEAARESLEEKNALVLAVVKAEIEAADEEAINAASVELGADKIGIVRTSAGCVIVKRPHPSIYKRFRDKGEAKTSDLEVLVRKSLVYPDVAKFETLTNEQPAILDHCANRVVELAGFSVKQSAGKS